VDSAATCVTGFASVVGCAAGAGFSAAGVAAAGATVAVAGVARDSAAGVAAVGFAGAWGLAHPEIAPRTHAITDHDERLADRERPMKQCSKAAGYAGERRFYPATPTARCVAGAGLPKYTSAAVSRGVVLRPAGFPSSPR